MRNFIVITTINEKTKAICEFEKLAGWHIVIVGDKKSRPIASGPNLTFLSIEDQQKLGFTITAKLPYNHYTRKNIGYLYAIREGANVIYDTDDDNVPYPHWGLEPFECNKLIQGESNFVNIYRHFSYERIWPRGFPLDLIRQSEKPTVSTTPSVRVGVWQGLADIDPDVDAIYRLIFNKPVTFERKEPVALPPGKYCPFNSQNTFWTRDAFPFLYLPATTSFRFTDILRGFIAQRLLWILGMHLGFHQATVYQKRNAHDFMRDFKDEVECYLNVKPIVKMINDMDFSGEFTSDILKLYKDLSRAGFVEYREVEILDAWLNDYKKTIS